MEDEVEKNNYVLEIILCEDELKATIRLHNFIKVINLSRLGL
jgi:hypothetical protein